MTDEFVTSLAERAAGSYRILGTPYELPARMHGALKA